MYHILVCDDDRDIVSALTIYLTGEGYAVTGAGSGQEALELFQQQSFDLVLMDIMMPGMDGITATAQLRTQSNVPIPVSYTHLDVYKRQDQVGVAPVKGVELPDDADDLHCSSSSPAAVKTG